MRSRGVNANAPLCAALIRSVPRACGFSSNRDTEPIVEKKSYELIQVFYTLAHFEMHFFVILPFDSAQGKRGTP